MSAPENLPQGLVHLVDDDPGILRALTRLLLAEGFSVRSFLSARAFLADFEAAEPTCLVLDVAMPELDGPGLQKLLTERGNPVPIIFITGHGDIPQCVRAIKAGAVEFLCKPVEDVTLLTAVRNALQVAQSYQATQTDRGELQARLAQLTQRERQVMSQVVAGKLNKQIAAELGIGLQTIKIHRMRMMAKMGVASVVELVRASDRLGRAD